MMKDNRMRDVCTCVRMWFKVTPYLKTKSQIFLSIVTVREE